VGVYRADAVETAADSWNKAVGAFSAGKYQEAAVFFRKAEPGFSDKASVHYYLGIALYHTGDFEEALRLLKSAGETEPDFRDYIYHYYLGASYYRKKLYKLAAVEMKAAISEHPDGKVAGKAGEALKEISLIGAVPDESYRWYLEAAKKGRESGNAEWAADYALEAFLLRPGDEAAAALLAGIYSDAGKPLSALKALEYANGDEARKLKDSIAGAMTNCLKETIGIMPSPGKEEPADLRESLLNKAKEAFSAGDNKTVTLIMEEMLNRWPDASETAEAAGLVGEIK